MTMIRCFLTGLEIPIEKALVLNRRSAVDLLGELKDRVARLRRMIEQFAPLDEEPEEELRPIKQRPRNMRKHRLVSAPAAAMLARSFPEIALFIGWQEYQAKARYIDLCAKRGCYQSADAIRALNDKRMRHLQHLGQQVLDLLDPDTSLPHDTRVVIAMGVCVDHLDRAPTTIVELILRDCARGDQRSLTMLNSADAARVMALVTDEQANNE